MAIPKKILLTGTTYIKYIDTPPSPTCGDVLLYLNDDSVAVRTYDDLTVSGYIKADVFDGLLWQHMDIMEFCLEKEHRFAKKQRAIDSAYLCKDIMETQGGVAIFRTYRGHYTRHEYEQGEYFRKQNKKTARLNKKTREGVEKERPSNQKGEVSPILLASH